MACKADVLDEPERKLPEIARIVREATPLFSRRAMTDGARAGEKAVA
jgi:hypothetical protein